MILGIFVACSVGSAGAGNASPGEVASWLTSLNPISLTDPAGNPMPLVAGRVNRLAVDPSDSNHLWAGSELGGVYESVDGGVHWQHVDAVKMVMITDVTYAGPTTIVVTGNYDGRVHSQGGIWMSRDGGQRWRKAAGSDPACSDEPSAHRIAVADDPPRIYVADDCGIATSADLGQTWQRIEPDTTPARYFDVLVSSAGPGVRHHRLDVCGDHGYFRSDAGGAIGTWTTRDLATPTSSVFLHPECRLALAPQDPDTVFLALEWSPTPWLEGELYETRDRTPPRTWTALMPGLEQARGNSHFIYTAPAADGDPGHFEVYASTGIDVLHQTCGTDRTPRCVSGLPVYCEPLGEASTGCAYPPWTMLPRLSAFIATDPGDLLFGDDGCPRFVAGDHGVFAVEGGCQPRALTPRNVGLDDYWVMRSTEHAVAGTSYADHVDLYFGTQDNSLFASFDGGQNWRNWSSTGEGDVATIAAAPLGPPVAALFMDYHATCADIGRVSYGAEFPLLSLPPGNVWAECPFVQWDRGKYAFITPSWATGRGQLQVTTDNGATWTQVGPDLPTCCRAHLKVAGPTNHPVFYFTGPGSNGAPVGLYRVDWMAGAGATLTGPLYGYSGFFSVNPDDPAELVVADRLTESIVFSHDGGLTWQPNEALKDAVTHAGEFKFVSGHLLEGAPYAPASYLQTIQPTAVGFVPGTAGILVGTMTAGTFYSPNDGADWFEVPGGEQIPRIAGFFFDAGSGAAYVGSAGRGLWRIDIPGIVSVDDAER